MNEQIKALMISGIQKPPSVPKEVVEPVQNIEVSRKEEISEAPVVYKIPAIPAKKDVSIATVHSVSPPKKQECTYLDTSTLPEKQDTSTVPPPVDKDRDERNVIEKLLGTNWLSKVGIVTFVLGIGFFVKYAIDQDWINEIGRVGIGLLTGGIIIGIAHKLKTKYHVFSSILVGGGISVFYITITLAFHEYELFSQTTAFVLLILTTVFSVLLSLFYDRKELAVFSLLGGFASPLMVSTGVGNYVVLFSYIFILNTGMLIVAYRKKWRIIGMISFILTLLFFWTWTLESYKDQFFNVSLFISLFYIQFYLLALLDHYKSVKKISAYQAFLILINNCSTFLAFIYVFDNYTYDVRGGITMALAVINAVILVILFRNNRIDRNMNYLIIAIVLSFVSLAIPIQLKGHVITLFWAAESVILLWLWQKSRINIFYNGFLLISLLMLVSYIMDVNHLYVFPNTMPFITNRLFITGVVIIAAFVINRLLLKRESPEYGNHKHIAGLFNVMIILLAYIVPLLEIDLQIYRFANPGLYVWPSLRFITLATFTTIYIAVLGIIYHRKISTKKYIFILLYLTVLLYAIYYTLLVMDFRYVIFRSLTEYNLAGYFFIHLLSLPAIAYIVYLVIRHIKSLPSKQSNWLSWLLTVLVVVILSVEVDNIVIWLFGNANNYDAVLYDVHTFGYPILWGVIAMILMIWGLNRKERLLRKISLVFFAFIIVKFYAYDVWKMSQSGRIISFVLLGVILLLVSFLQQKIRTLVKNDKETEVEHNELSE
jgi:uncharacterized membrane protein